MIASIDEAVVDVTQVGGFEVHGYNILNYLRSFGIMHHSIISIPL
jgi:hypothetical protein